VKVLEGWEQRIQFYLRTAPTPPMPMHWTTRLLADRRCARCGEVLRGYGATVSARDVPSCDECQAHIDAAVGRCTHGDLPRWREIQTGMSVCVQLEVPGFALVYKLGPEVFWAYLAAEDRGGRLPEAAISEAAAVRAAEAWMLRTTPIRHDNS
jgi:hypothetical protein